MDQDEKAVNGEYRKIHESSRFGQGFITGILVTLCVLMVCWIGYMVLDGGLLGSNSADALQEKGASVLTDGATISKLKEVEKLIEQNYLDEVDGQLLTDFLFRGVAVGLDDPYASYYTEDELQSVLDSSSGEYFGIGVTLSEDRTTGVISVAQVYEDSPAYEAGLEVDDIVKKVDGESVEGIDLSDLVTLIKGKEGAFTMTVYRPESEQEVEVTLECAQVEIHQVDYRMLESRIGYIELLEFTQNAVSQVEDALLDLKKQGMEKLIIDLRGNPGGLLDAVCDIADMFLDDGRIVYMEDKNGRREEYYAESGKILDCEVAVLTDRYSASASEIFAGVIQDYDLGPVVGEQTYGKGVVQVTFSLNDGSAFKMTVEKYYTAKGQDIDGNGITPDIIIEETDTEEMSEETEDKVLQTAVEALLENEGEAGTGGKDGE